MSRARWSFGRRFTLWAVVATVGLVGLSAGLGAWFLRGAVEREVEALVNEELEEMRVGFSVSDRSVDDFERIAWHLEEEHPANPMAWRVLGAGGETWAEVGPTRLLAAAVGSEPEIPLVRREGRLAGGLRAVLVLDAASQFGALRRYGGFSLATLAAFGLLAATAGALFCRAVGRRLEHVAAWIRRIAEAPLDERESGDEATDENAPDEIRGITDALTELLDTVRAESERASLLMMGMAHELRSPIQNLLGQTEIALLRDRSGVEYRDVLSSQLEELRHFARVVDNLVTLCAAGSRESGVQREEFDLGEEVRLRLARERERAERSGVRLEVTLRGDLRLRGDREAMLLALGNLVGNALDWSPRGTSVHVALDGTASELHLTVDDAGPGIPAEERERIFEPFYHGPAPGGARVGFGLGLALTRAAVEAHHGRVEVGASPGGGARFEIAVPRGSRGPRAGTPLRSTG